jgi:hypothetical protein
VELATVGLLDRLCRVAPGEIAKDANAPTARGGPVALRP